MVTVPLTGEWVQAPGFNANGIAQTPDGRALLVVNSGSGILFRVNPPHRRGRPRSTSAGTR